MFTVSQTFGEEKNYKEVAAGEVIAVEAVPLPLPAGSFHTETRHAVVFFSCWQSYSHSRRVGRLWRSIFDSDQR